MAPFSRAPRNLTTLFVVVLSRLQNPCGNFYLGWAGRVRESSDWAGHTPRTPLGRFGWSGSAHSPLLTELPTDSPLFLLFYTPGCLCVRTFFVFTYLPVGPQLYSLIYASANPVRGVVDRKTSEANLQIYDDIIKKMKKKKKR